jgi:hypothetical protein
MKAMSNDYIYRTPSIYDSQAPGNGLFASMFVFYPLVFMLVFVGFFGLHESPLYNENIWGVNGQKEFTIFYAFLSLIVFRNIVILLFFWHLIDFVNNFRRLITRLSLSDCGIFLLSSISLFFVARSVVQKTAVTIMIFGTVLYFNKLRKFLNGQRSLSLKNVIFINTIFATILLVFVFPLF